MSHVAHESHVESLMKRALHRAYIFSKTGGIWMDDPINWMVGMASHYSRIASSLHVARSSTAVDVIRRFKLQYRHDECILLTGAHTLPLPLVPSAPAAPTLALRLRGRLKIS